LSTVFVGTAFMPSEYKCDRRSPKSSFLWGKGLYYHDCLTL